MNIIIEALGAGMLVGIAVGPILFAIVQSSLKDGFLAGFAVSMGILLSDILLVIACYWGLSQLTDLQENHTFNLIFSLLSGLFIIGFGLMLWFKKTPTSQELQAVSSTSKPLYGHFLKGFIVNIFNPFGFLYWTTLMTSSMITRSFSENQIILYFGIVLFIIAMTDTLKAFFAHKIRHRLTPRHIGMFSKVASVVVVGVGLFIIFQVINS